MRLSTLRKLGRPIVPRDLRNPRRKNGYSYVQRDDRRTALPGSRPYQAYAYEPNGGPARPVAFLGPCRATVEEAVQDFCDWFNGTPLDIPATLVTAGHEYEVDERDTDPEYEAALGVIRDRTAQRKGKQGYVYLIVEDIPGGGLEYGKIGFSTNPRKRVAELQTGNPRPLRLHLMKPGTEADEGALHRKYIKDNILQEWFRLTKPLLLEWDAEHQVSVRAA